MWVWAGNVSNQQIWTEAQPQVCTPEFSHTTDVPLRLSPWPKYMLHSACFPYFVFSDFSLQKSQALHRNASFLSLRLSLKDRLQSFCYPQLYPNPHYLVSKQEQVTCCKQQFPVVWLCRAQLTSWCQYTGNKGHIWTSSQSRALPSWAQKDIPATHKTEDLQGLSEASGQFARIRYSIYNLSTKYRDRKRSPLELVLGK